MPKTGASLPPRARPRSESHVLDYEDEDEDEKENKDEPAGQHRPDTTPHTARRPEAPGRRHPVGRLPAPGRSPPPSQPAPGGLCPARSGSPQAESTAARTRTAESGTLAKRQNIRSMNNSM